MKAISRAKRKHLIELVEIEEYRRPQPKDMDWHLEPDEVAP